ncbi:hypothetical protein Pcinc_032074 [Petrolisthes cinctipes]|uniref:Uncharacterized protein n=1 Tax=Petrolisthes cinctipes TaxID=88211 RepID=A0AAE1K1L7_PETCI|nr:hypothetical protein Pcinc_032074 [Petrolisthes cinctipes]
MCCVSEFLNLGPDQRTPGTGGGVVIVLDNGWARLWDWGIDVSGIEDPAIDIPQQAIGRVTTPALTFNISQAHH